MVEVAGERHYHVLFGPHRRQNETLRPVDVVAGQIALEVQLRITYRLAGV